MFNNSIAAVLFVIWYADANGKQNKNDQRNEMADAKLGIKEIEAQAQADNNHGREDKRLTHHSLPAGLTGLV